jgi:integrase
VVQDLLCEARVRTIGKHADADNFRWELLDDLANGGDDQAEGLGRQAPVAGDADSQPGGPIRHRNFYMRSYRPAVGAAGLPLGLRFHDLRHTAAAILIDQGCNEKQLQ